MPKPLPHATTPTAPTQNTGAAGLTPRIGVDGERGQTRYVRQRDLPRLIAIWPAELADPGLAGHGRLVAKIRRALREERRRGQAGNWTYDLARHAQLLTAYRAELSDLARRMAGRQRRAP